MPNIREVERAHVAKLQAKLDALTRAHYPDPERRTLVVGHREYLITWNGSIAATREEVPWVGAEPRRLCACGCGQPLRTGAAYASNGCAGRAWRGVPTCERVSTGSRT